MVPTERGGLRVLRGYRLGIAQQWGQHWPGSSTLREPKAVLTEPVTVTVASR
jgi:hypothetical protein